MTDGLADREWLREQLEAGRSYTEIADECGVTWHTVSNWIQRHAIPFGAPGPDPLKPEEVMEDVMRVARDLGHAPSRAEYLERGSHSPQTVAVKWGTWLEAKEEAADRL